MACVPRDELQYFVFDYLNDHKSFGIVNNENFPKNFVNFIKNELLLNETTVLSEIRTLGPPKYNRAQLILVAILMPNDSFITFNDTLETFCRNQSFNGKMIIDTNKRKIDAYQFQYTFK